ncbi:MAG: triose-phosphate isomerase [Deltaproteobacteria bacterium]|nr:triose-phosphate isomerase [Deltaproteobacteria bacterium]
MSARRPLVAGNWKLNKTVKEATGLARDLKGRLAAARDAEVAVAPVFTALASVKEALAGSAIALSGQNVHFEDQGAFTGEVSAPLLVDVGCTYCIVGHSERRHVFGDTDENVNKRAHALLNHGVTPILCVGEQLEEREAGKTLDVVLGQLALGLANYPAAKAKEVVIAYEPVWAIGTGRTASPADAQEVHEAIRGRLGEIFDTETAGAIRILYGGSVKASNAKELLSQADIDGALVGGASLTADTFVPIVEAAG